MVKRYLSTKFAINRLSSEKTGFTDDRRRTDARVKYMSLCCDVAQSWVKIIFENFAKHSQQVIAALVSELQVTIGSHMDAATMRNLFSTPTK